jgi:hypothetical protein
VLGRIDLIKVLSESSARARRGERASAYLRGVGLKSATVVIDNGSRKSVWRVPELDIDLDHKRSRSSIAGRAKIDSLAGPWTLNFRTYEHESAKSLQLAVSVQGLVPRGLARTLPQLAGLESFDVPVWGDAKLDLSSTGEILGGTIGIDAAPGQVLLPWLVDTAAHRRRPSRAVLWPSHAPVQESSCRMAQPRAVHQPIVHGAGPEGPAGLSSTRREAGSGPSRLCRAWTSIPGRRGVLAGAGQVLLSQFLLRAGGGVSAQGDVRTWQAPCRPISTRSDKCGDIFKTLWPRLWRRTPATGSCGDWCGWSKAFAYVGSSAARWAAAQPRRR